jgi:hypothetical protein
MAFETGVVLGAGQGIDLSGTEDGKFVNGGAGDLGRNIANGAGGKPFVKFLSNIRRLIIWKLKSKEPQSRSS